MEGWAIAIGAVVAAWLARRQVLRRRRSRRAEAVARELVPEIQSLMKAADPKSASEGEPGTTPIYAAHKLEMPSLFSREVLFAVETFYQCLEAYGDARRHMIESFADSSDVSLGDRIRAKDLRDRCLKDLFYSGAASVEHLEKLC